MLPLPERTDGSIAGRIALTYLAAGATWAVISQLLPGTAGFPLMGRLGFVTVTTALLYALLRRFVRRLNESQQALRMTQFVTDKAGEAVFWIEPTGKLRYANEVACRNLGHRADQLQVLTVFDIDPDLTPESWERMWAELRDRTCVRVERTHVRRDGTTFPVDITANYVRYGADMVACVFASDVSERRQMEQELRASEERLRKALLEAPVPMMLHAEDGQILLLSRMWTECSGYSASDIPSVREWLARSGAGTWEAMREKYRLTSPVDEGTVHVRTRSGVMREWEMQSSPLGALADGRRMLLTVGIDTTDRSALQKQFLQSQKMEAVGRLAAGIAHDFNNLLTLILGYGQMLMRQPPAEKTESYAAEIVRAGERASTLTHQLLAFTRQRQFTGPVVVELAAEIRSLDQMLRRIIGEDVHLILDLAPDTGHVLLDSTQFGQVLINLMVNARDAMPEGGAIRIATRAATLPDAREPESVGSLEPGDYAVVHVTDTGLGLPPEVLAHLFDPAFTPGEHGHGSGLALPTVQRIVRRARGMLTVESTPGEGTTFAVWLPVARLPEPAASEPGTQSGSVSNSCIAVVEDDSAVRTFVVEVLRSAGFGVIEAGSPEEALGLLSVFEEPLHLLLTDVVLPGMNGIDLAGKLQAVRPGLRVLFISGYAEGAGDPDTVPETWQFLSKPFSADDLLASVSRVLREAAAR